MKHDNNRDTSAPRHANFCPNVRSFQCPRCEQYDKLIGSIQEFQNIFLKFITDFDVRFVKENDSSSIDDFPRNLTCYPSIFSRMTYKNTVLLLG